MKILKSKKALSPVVASIILIAVTVAVSIAVAAWMGALTFTFTSTEELKITGLSFEGTTAADKKIVISVRNSGSSTVTLAEEVYVGGILQSADDVTIADSSLSPAESTTIDVEYEWQSGQSYQVKIATTKGNVFTYVATAPS